MKTKELRTQTITLENRMECIINHNSRHICEGCKKEIIWALIPIELVSLAKWDVHKCDIEKIITPDVKNENKRANFKRRN